ncbi:MAG: SusC/RagA family TonB-linked outer membrane protein, partial [Pedobacter sp.]
MKGFSQTLPVTGRVVSAADKQPMIGVTVSVKGTSNGVTTKDNGSFTIGIPAGKAILTISYTGFKTKELSVTGGQTNIDISLDEDTQNLNDVVVVGYSSKRQSELTSAVTVVSSEKLKDVTANDIGTMLQGKVAGLQVVNSSGAPGAVAEIRLRGVSSVNASQSPLFVVDGIIGGNYDPNDVESITVLKDAGATALYGSQANAGVIIVTTKSAKQGETRFEAKFSTGFRTADFGKMDLMNSNELYDYQKEFYRDYIVGATDNSYKIDLVKFYAERPLSLRNQDYDWAKESFRRAPLYNFYLSASGKTEKNDYYVGASYYKEKGTFINTNFERVNLRGNSTYHFSKKLDVSNNINLSASQGNSYDYMDVYYSFLNMPWDNPYDENGNATYVDGNSTFKWWSRDKINPINTVQNSNHPYKGFNVNYDLSVNYRITPWLTFASSNRVAASFDKGTNFVSPVAAGTYHKSLLETNGKIVAPTQVTMKGAKSIVMKPGFEVKAGSIFRANIEGCPPAPSGYSINSEEKPDLTASNTNSVADIVGANTITTEATSAIKYESNVFAAVSDKKIYFEFTLENDENVTLVLFNSFAGEVLKVIDNK